VRAAPRRAATRQFFTPALALRTAPRRALHARLTLPALPISRLDVLEESSGSVTKKFVGLAQLFPKEKKRIF